MRAPSLYLLVWYSLAMMASDQVLARDLGGPEGCATTELSESSRDLTLGLSRQPQLQRLPRTTDSRLRTRENSSYCYKTKSEIYKDTVRGTQSSLLGTLLAFLIKLSAYLKLFSSR